MSSYKTKQKRQKTEENMPLVIQTSELWDKEYIKQSYFVQMCLIYTCCT